MRIHTKRNKKRTRAFYMRLRAFICVYMRLFVRLRELPAMGFYPCVNRARNCRVRSSFGCSNTSMGSPCSRI